MTAPNPATTPWVPVGPGPPVAAGAPYARVYRSTAQSIPNAVWAMVSFDTVRNDTTGMWSAANPTRLTCKLAGTYAVSGHLIYTPSASGSQRTISLFVNGIYLAQQGPQQAPTSANYPRLSANTVVQLQVGDYVELGALHDAGAALNTVPSDASTQLGGTEMSMALIGGPKGDPGPGTPSYGTTLPASPYDGQEAILVDSLTNPSYQWRFRYNAGHTGDAYKWEFVGGASAYVTLGSDSATGPAWPTWGDLPTVGPALVVARAGLYLVQIKSHVTSSVSGGAPAINARSTTTAEPADGIAYTGQPGANAATMLFTSLSLICAAGDTIKMRYSLIAGGTGTWDRRGMTVTPVRVS